MRRLYSVLMMLAAPAAFAVVLVRGLRDRAYWAAPWERFGY
jgi:3-deoxy-D-manno-octulosonic-acid transferase